MESKLHSAQLYRYELPLKKPLPGGDGCSIRTGLLIRVSFSNGKTLCAEASPLPNFSPESIEDAQQECMAILSDLHSMPAEKDLIELRKRYEGLKCPSVRFAAEILMLKYWGLTEDKNWPYLLNPKISRSVSVNGLLEGDEDEWSESVTQFIETGMNTIKVKLGSQSLFRTLEKLAEISENTSADVKWRFDANQAWDLSEAKEICKAMELLPVDYLEEPLKNISEWNELASSTTVPLALDETLLNISFSDLERFKGLDSIILKPTICGGVINCMDWMDAANQLGVRTTLTSSFESWIGLQNIAELQSACGIDTPAGLGTLDWFHYHPDCAPHNAVIMGEIMVSGRSRSQDITQTEHMTLVESWPKSPAR